MKISDNTIMAVKQASIIDIISQYTILKKHGAEYKGLCPFHEESTPSFYVHPVKGYKCFGCNAKGSNAISFIMNYENKAYPDAISIVAGMAGIQIDRHEGNYQTQYPLITRKALKTKTVPISFFPSDVFEASLKSAESNNFERYLINLFGNEITCKLISRYFIGSTNHRFTNKAFPDYVSEMGANIFWQIDIHGNTRTGKIILYNAKTGERIRKPFDHVNWMHSTFRLKEFELAQCFFGEHLLTAEPWKPVAIVESEKTAIIASVYFPQFIWLAAGSLTNLNATKCRVLKGRKVVLFPDKGAITEWTKKAEELDLDNLRVSDFLEVKNAEAKSDLADYLVKFDINTFIPNFPEPLEVKENIHEIEGELTFICETHTGFDGMILGYTRTTTGKEYDLLFPADIDAPPITEQTAAVHMLAACYNKTFVQARYKGVLYLVNIINNNLEPDNPISPKPR